MQINSVRPPSENPFENDVHANETMPSIQQSVLSYRRLLFHDFLHR